MADGTKKRDRSPNFPFISLGMALERARAFYNREKRGAAPVPVAVTHWTYSPKSSGGLQTVAALKSYGLLDEDGRGEERRIRLSETALRILLDERQDHQERRDLMRSAALTPAVFREIYEKWPSDMPSDANLNHFLLFDLQFNPVVAKDAAKIYKENAILARLYESDVVSKAEELSGEVMVQNWGETMPSSGPSAPKMGTDVSTERIIGPTGQIVVQFLGEPSLNAYQFLQDYIKLRMNILSRETSQTTGTKEAKTGS